MDRLENRGGVFDQALIDAINAEMPDTDAPGGQDVHEDATTEGAEGARSVTGPITREGRKARLAPEDSRIADPQARSPGAHSVTGPITDDAPEYETIDIEQVTGGAEESAPEPEGQSEAAQEGGNAPESAESGIPPALEPEPEEADAEEAPTGEGLPAYVLEMLGVDGEEAARERLTEIAVSGMVESGVPEAAAREIVRLRMQVSGMPGGRGMQHIRNPTRAAGVSGEPDAGAQAAAGQGMPGAQSDAGQAANPRLDHLAKQAQQIQARTGVDMLEVLRGNSEIMAKVSAYSEGRGGADMYAAYNMYRDGLLAGKARARVPGTITPGGGQRSRGEADISQMSQAQFDEINRKLEMGIHVRL